MLDGMRILALDLGPSWRGGQVQTYLVARALAGRGHDVVVGAREESPLARRAADAGLGLLPLPGGGEASPLVLIRLARGARAFAPDVVWAGDAKAHGAAAWSRVSRRTPLAVHRRVLKPPGAHPLSRLKYALADRYLAVSAAARDVLVGAGVPAQRTVVVPDGLPPEAFVEGPAPEAPPFRLVHAGAFDGRKGQAVFVEALARLVAAGLDVRATFLGEGPVRASGEAQARGLGVAERCAFEGGVDDVPRRLAASHLLLLPSESEASPLVLLEAMAAGCPVLAHDVGGISELTRSGACGRLVPTLDPEAWARAARDLLLDAAARAALVRAGRDATAGRTVEATAALVESELARVARLP